MHSLDNKIKKILEYLLLWMENTKVESFMEEGWDTKMETGSCEEVCLYTSHPAHFSMNLWTSHPCLDLIFSSWWQPDHLHSLPWKEPICFANQHPSFACWTQPILINLARILHLHKTRLRIGHVIRAFIKPASPCSSQSTLLVSSWICVSRCKPWPLF